MNLRYSHLYSSLQVCLNISVYYFYQMSRRNYYHTPRYHERQLFTRVATLEEENYQEEYSGVALRRGFRQSRCPRHQWRERAVRERQVESQEEEVFYAPNFNFDYMDEEDDGAISPRDLECKYNFERENRHLRRSPLEEVKYEEGDCDEENQEDHYEEEQHFNFAILSQPKEEEGLAYQWNPSKIVPFFPTTKKLGQDEHMIFNPYEDDQEYDEQGDFCKDQSAFQPLPMRYKTELCKKWVDTNGMCPYGEKCRFAHGQGEKHLRLQQFNTRYRSKPCFEFHKNLYCPYGDKCLFYHGEKLDEMWRYSLELAGTFQIGHQEAKVKQISCKLEQIIISGFLSEQRTSCILAELQSVLFPDFSPLLAKLHLQFEDDSDEQDDSGDLSLKPICTSLLSQILVYVQENGPMQSEPLRTILRLITQVTLNPISTDFKNYEALNFAAEFLMIIFAQTSLHENMGGQVKHSVGESVENLRILIDKRYFQVTSQHH